MENRPDLKERLASLADVPQLHIGEDYLKPLNKQSENPEQVKTE